MKTQDLKISIEPINIRPSDDKNLETSDGGSHRWYGATDMKN